MKSKWLNYYTEKRIVQQWLQLRLLGKIEAKRILEVGPAIGGVTAMLVNADYDVTTLDMIPKNFNFPETPHIQQNLLTLDPYQIEGMDAIICCETLEHIDWDKVHDVLCKFRKSGAQYLIVSVPYMGFQCTLDIYFNRYIFREYFSLKKFNNFKKFKRQPEGGHQWEVGYKGYSVRAWEDVIQSCGWTIKIRDFSVKTRSIFHLLEATSVGSPSSFIF